MKLNGLTNNLAGNDKSLSNSYLSHIVELLRKELDSLTKQFNVLNEEATEHIETQKTVVETKQIKAEDINGKIKFLYNAIEMFGTAKLNGYNILTDETFQGPFTYKGEVKTLPETANAGDVYIYDGKVSIYNGTSYDSFIIPVGMVSKSEYDVDQLKVNQSISENKSDINTIKEDVLQLATNVGVEISNINTALENTVEKNPADGKVYVRKNNEWIEQSAANNTVEKVAGDSVISNTVVGVKIESPKVEINSNDIKVNGTTLTQADKFGLTVTENTNENLTWYSYEYGRSNVGSGDDVEYGYCSYDGSNRFYQKENMNQKYFVATKNYQYVKQSDSATWADGHSFRVISMDSKGKIKNMYIPGGNQQYNALIIPHATDFIAWNPQYVPEGLEDTVYMLYVDDDATATTTSRMHKAVLVEYDKGDFKKSYDLTPQLSEYTGFTGFQYMSDGWSYLGTGGKSLRSKTIQRICITIRDERQGSTQAVIIGGDKNSKVTDPFDPSKAMFVKLPATAYFGYYNMAATDSAWYLTEYATGRIMRITPNGRVTEYNLSTAYQTTEYNYIEYTDKNNRPACAYHFHVDSTNGKVAVAFFEEKDDGGVNFVERNLSPMVFAGWSGALWRFIENDYYIFWTSSVGWSNGGENSFDSAANHKKLIYFDKKTLTLHIIDDVFEMTNDWGDGACINMVKTRGNAIWLVPQFQNCTDAQRTGIIKYINNVDYTDIDETNTDKGSITINDATIGTEYPWFIHNETYGWNTHSYSNSYGSSSLPVRYFAVNDDGILMVLSSDLKAFALCYGEGNIKVYKVGDPGKDYRYYPDVQQIAPFEINTNSSFSHGLFPLQHGWVYRCYGYSATSGANKDLREAFVYIGLVYKNGEPTILERPIIDPHPWEQQEDITTKEWFNYYGYNLTYDDYERRKLLLRGIYKDIRWSRVLYGYNGYWKEVEHNAVRKINLTYEDKVISSAEI